MTASPPRSRAWIFDFITMVAVIVGLIYGGVELRQLRQEQELRGVLELHRIIQSPEHVRAMDWMLHELEEGVPPGEFVGSLSPDERVMRLQVELTWESVGIMVFRRDVPLEWVDEFYRYPILTSWKKLRPHIEHQREQTGYNGVAEWFQWLAEQLESRPEGESAPAYSAYEDWQP